MNTIIELPNSKESEMMVLGCMLTSIEWLNIASESMNDSDFYYTEHKIIFQILKASYENEKPTDVHLVCEELKRLDKLKAVGGVAYITTLAQYVGTSAYIEEYIEEVKILCMQRNLVQAGKKMQEQALERKNPSKIVLEIQNAIKQIEEYRTIQDKFLIKSISDLGECWFEVEPSPKKMIFEYTDDNGCKQGFIPKGNVCMLVGMGGIGKSHWVAQLTISLATQTPFLDIFIPTSYSQGGIFLGLAENDMEDIQRLLFKPSNRLFLKQNPSSIDLFKHSLKHRIYPFSFQGHQCQFINDDEPTTYFFELKRRLINSAPQEGWSLVVLDPISRFLGAEAETDNAAATAFIALMEQLTQELPGNPTILFCHHMNKSGISGKGDSQHAARGSSAITDGVRLQINLRKFDTNEEAKIKEHDMELEEAIVMTMSKSNFTAILKDVYIHKQWDGHLKLLPQKSSKKKSYGRSKSGDY